MSAHFDETGEFPVPFVPRAKRAGCFDDCELWEGDHRPGCPNDDWVNPEES